MVRRVKSMPRYQQKRVMAVLREKGFKQKPKRITLEKRFVSARIRSPEEFQQKTIRNIPAGKDTPLGTRLKTGRLKGRKTTTIQSINIPKAVFFDGKKFKKI